MEKDTYLEFIQPYVEDINGTIIWGDQHANTTAENALQHYLNEHSGTSNNFTSQAPLRLQCTQSLLIRGMDTIADTDKYRRRKSFLVLFSEGFARASIILYYFRRKPMAIHHLFPFSTSMEALFLVIYSRMLLK